MVSPKQPMYLQCTWVQLDCIVFISFITLLLFLHVHIARRCLHWFVVVLSALLFRFLLSCPSTQCLSRPRPIDAIGVVHRHLRHYLCLVSAGQPHKHWYSSTHRRLELRTPARTQPDLPPLPASVSRAPHPNLTLLHLSY
jgi:hypothetical protein